MTDTWLKLARGDGTWDLPTVASVIAQGAQVFVRHLRPERFNIGNPFAIPTRQDSYFVQLTPRPANFGGKTIVRVLTSDGRWAEGSAQCGRKEQYDRTVGTTIALCEALQKLGDLDSELTKHEIEKMVRVNRSIAAHQKRLARKGRRVLNTLADALNS